MFGFLRNRRRLFWLVAVAVPLILFSYGAWRWHTVAKLQRSLNRNYEIDFNEGGKPSAMPAFLDRWIYAGLKRIDWSQPAYDSLVRERVRMVFRGPVRKLSIYFPKGVDENLGPALENFPSLEAFFLEEPADERGDFLRVIPPLFDSLGKLEHLRELQLFGSWIGEEQIREMAGWQSLGTLGLEFCEIPEGMLTELAHSASLKQLILYDNLVDRELTAAEVKAEAKRDPFAAGAIVENPRKWKPSPEGLKALSRAGIKLEWE